jgi:hypothetical protein
MMIIGRLKRNILPRKSQMMKRKPNPTKEMKKNPHPLPNLLQIPKIQRIVKKPAPPPKPLLHRRKNSQN